MFLFILPTKPNPAAPLPQMQQPSRAISIPQPAQQGGLKRVSSFARTAADAQLSRTYDPSADASAFLNLRIEEETVQGAVEFLSVDDPLEAGTPKAFGGAGAGGGSGGGGAGGGGGGAYAPRWLVMRGGEMQLHAAQGGALLAQARVETILSLRARAQPSAVDAAGSLGSAAAPLCGPAGVTEFCMLLRAPAPGGAGGSAGAARVQWNIRAASQEAANSFLFYLMRGQAVLLERLKGRAVALSRRRDPELPPRLVLPFAVAAEGGGAGGGSGSSSSSSSSSSSGGGASGGASGSGSGGGAPSWDVPSAAAGPAEGIALRRSVVGLAGSYHPRNTSFLGPRAPAASFQGGSRGGSFLAPPPLSPAEEEEDAYAPSPTAPAGPAALRSSISSTYSSDEEEGAGQGASGSSPPAPAAAASAEPSLFDDEFSFSGGSSPTLLQRASQQQHVSQREARSQQSQAAAAASASSSSASAAAAAAGPAAAQSAAATARESTASTDSSTSSTNSSSTTTTSAVAAAQHLAQPEFSTLVRQSSVSSTASASSTGSTKYVPPHLRRQGSLGAVAEDCVSATLGSDAPAGSGGGGSGGSGGRSPPPASPLPAIPRPPNLSPHSIFTGSGTAVHGVWCSQGVRPSMEDAHVALEHVERAGGVAARLPPLPASLGGLAPPPPPPAAAAAAHLETDFYAVFDGHGGTLAADFSAATLLQHLLAHEGFSSAAGLSAALCDAFLATDRAFLQLVDAALSGSAERGRCGDKWRSGSTALAAVVRGGEIAVASLGDCRAVLSVPSAAAAPAAGEGGGGCPLRCTCRYLAQDLSREHTPSSESARIEGAGGWVQTEQELSLGALHYLDPTHPFVAARLLEGGGRMRKWHCVSRLNGELGVSRALGDADYKGAARMGAYPWCWPKGVPPRDFAADLVLAEPAVQLARVPSRSCAHCRPFLILACDGLWEVLESQEAVDIVAGALLGGLGVGQHHGEHAAGASSSGGGGGGSGSGSGGAAAAEAVLPIVAARQLVDIAIRLGTSDNVSAVVVLL